MQRGKNAKITGSKIIKLTQTPKLRVLQYTFYHQVFLNICKNDKIDLFQLRQPQLLISEVSCSTRCKQTVPGSLRRTSGPQTLQIWKHWTISYGMQEKYYKLQPEPKMIDDLKVAPHKAWEQLPQELTAVRTYTKI